MIKGEEVETEDAILAYVYQSYPEKVKLQKDGKEILIDEFEVEDDEWIGISAGRESIKLIDFTHYLTSFLLSI